MKLCEDQKEEQHVGFYQHRRYRDTRYNVMLALKKPGQVNSSGTVIFVAVRPYNGNTAQQLPLSELLRDFRRVSPAEIEGAWKRLYEHSGSHCAHQNPGDCPGQSCDFKTRHKVLHPLVLLLQSACPAVLMLS